MNKNFLTQKKCNNKSLGMTKCQFHIINNDTNKKREKEHKVETIPHYHYSTFCWRFFKYANSLDNNKTKTNIGRGFHVYPRIFWSYFHIV